MFLVLVNSSPRVNRITIAKAIKVVLDKKKSGTEFPLIFYQRIIINLFYGPFWKFAVIIMTKGTIAIWTSHRYCYRKMYQNQFNIDCFLLTLFKCTGRVRWYSFSNFSFLAWFFLSLRAAVLWILSFQYFFFISEHCFASFHVVLLFALHKIDGGAMWIFGLLNWIQ